MTLGQLRKILNDLANDLTAFAGDEGMSYLLADRVRRLSADLEGSGYLPEGSNDDIIDLR